MQKLKSRKLIVSILTAILVVVNDKYQLGISQEAIYSAVAVIAVYVVGQGVADAGAQGKKSGVVIAEGEEEGSNWEDTSEEDDKGKELLG